MKPFLDTPAPGWQGDLPGPNEPPQGDLNILSTSKPPNHCDDIYLELPRSSSSLRGAGIATAICILPICLLTALLLIEALVNSAVHNDGVVILGTIAAFCASIWIFLYCWRTDTEAPIDEPIRFNRARRKVYAYQFRYNFWNVFSKKSWRTEVEICDWDQMRAELCTAYGTMGAGGMIETVTLAEMLPNSKRVKTRFFFTHNHLHGTDYWNLAQIYMQSGRQALPKFQAAGDRNSKTTFFKIAHRFAPCVRWDSDIDLESRTAPQGS